jgi:ribosomal protein L19
MRIALRITGIVIGLYNKGVMRSVELRNVIDGVPVEVRIPLLSPLVKDVEILARRKKVMRRKLYVWHAWSFHRMVS